MSREQSPGTPTVVIVGGGFGGIHAARGLRDAPVNLTVVDRRNHHLFQPLLYQVASAVLSPADISQPIRRILRSQRNATVILGEVVAVDLARQQVVLGAGELPYDYLVLAAGATHSYFGHEEQWAPRAPGLKTIEDGLEIRRRILLAFEGAELEADDDARQAQLTFVVVGGGPTGVELAGALKEIAARSIPADFRLVDTTTARVVLIEGLTRLLPSMSERAGQLARRDLEAMGVEVRTGRLVTDVTDTGVCLGDERLEAANVFWAAGVRASPLGASLGVEADPAGRVKVAPDCSVPGYPNVFVVGDLAALVDPETGSALPGVAQVAMQMGDFVARIIESEIMRDESAQRRPVFRYRDKGSLATIGRIRAVADIGGHTFGGIVAWLLWAVVHILFLIGFRNRLFVMLSWAWNYGVYTKGARLITGDSRLGLKRPRAFSSSGWAVGSRGGPEKR